MGEKTQKTMSIDVDTLIGIIGKKEVQIELLNRALAQMSEELAQCQKELETLKQHPMLKKQDK